MKQFQFRKKSYNYLLPAECVFHNWFAGCSVDQLMCICVDELMRGCVDAFKLSTKQTKLTKVTK